MKQYKKEKLVKTKLFISYKFTISKIDKNLTICVTRMRYEDPTHMHNAPQPTSSPNHHTVHGWGNTRLYTL